MYKPKMMATRRKSEYGRVPCSDQDGRNEYSVSCTPYLSKADRLLSEDEVARSTEAVGSLEPSKAFRRVSRLKSSKGRRSGPIRGRLHLFSLR